MTRSLFTLIAGLAVIAMPVAHAPTSAQIAAAEEQATAPRPPRSPTQSQSVSYTHYVRPDGSPTSFCSANEPCSLPRAVSLIGSANMRPGSLVLLQRGADGVYSQAALTFDGSGTAGEPIRFIGENGVRLTGTRARAPAAQWTRVPEREFTYRIAWDDAATFAVSNVAQRPPVTTWRPIRVDDRLPPYTQSLGRPFTLDFPIRYTARTSVATVEAQHCTFWADRQNDVVYVHMCHDGPPAEADNLFLGPSGWGSVVINGDYLSLENIAIEQVSGTALKVNPSASGTVLRNVAARAAQVWLEGVNTVAEDLDVSHVISQGPIGGTCYDANPDFGRGECWNAAGDGGALLVGRAERDSSKGQVVRRARVHRSWNGGRIDGQQTLTESQFWGFPNHTLEASGTGGVISYNTFLNGQDSIFLKDRPFDNLTVEHNLFVNMSYFTVSNDGRGGTTPSIGWRFRYNILTSIVFDEKAYATVEADCNLYVPNAATSALMQIVGSDGGRDVSYTSLDQIRARTPLDRRSIALPSSKWRDGTLFRRYEGQSSPNYDFSPVSPELLELCGQRVGPNFSGDRAIPRRD